ncbi:MAG TPA: O-antigen ligase family protein [Rhizomicrobium sp.]|nr:O-antigen ligase family protein [Rhizomicrobium sp.]
MEAVAKSYRTFSGRPSGYSTSARHPSLLATAMSYLLILYIYSSFAWIVMAVYPAIKVAYLLYLLLATLPFLAAVNRSVIDVFYDHLPFLLLIALYFAYVSIQYVLFGMATIPSVRDDYFVKGQFVATILFSLVAFELSFNFRHLLIALYAVVIFSCAVNLVEFFDPLALPMQFTTVPGRAAGFYLNPNISALFIASAVPLLCWRAGGTSRLLCYAVTGIGTFLTFSRGGWALWFVAVAITELARVDWRNFQLTTKSVIGISAGLICAIALIVAFGPAFSFLVQELAPNLDSNTATRLELLNTETTLDRLELARQGLIAFTSAPIFGHGVGYTVQWEFGLSVHNMFVLMLAEQGIIGLIWLIVLIAVWWRYPRPFGWWLAILFCAAAPTTHNYFDGALPAVLIALYLVAPHRLSAAASVTTPSADRRA